jgi:hypothetical protein
VPQSLFSGAINEAAGCGMPIYYAPLPGEAEGLEDRVLPVAGVTMVQTGGPDPVALEMGAQAKRCTLVVQDASGIDDLEVEARHVTSPTILRNGSELALCTKGGVVARIGTLEPSSFGETLPSGYLLADITDAGIASSEWVERALHPFVVRRVRLSEPENTTALDREVGDAVKDVDRSACLRIELRGRIPLGVYVNTEDLAARLARYFYYVEISDECTTDIHAGEIENDVSLIAEFVCLVSEDDSLSANERTRILRCGWNALNGKGLVE